MKKYDKFRLPELQARIDNRFGKGVYKAALILLLFGMLSVSFSPTALFAQTPPTQAPPVVENPRTPLPRITITDTGQTTTLNNIAAAPDTPDDGLQRIRDVYFAKKNVTANGTHLAFTRIDSVHTQRDAQNQLLTYDSILGKTVYLIIETNNMRAMEIDIAIRPSSKTMTGNTDTLNLMRFNSTNNSYEATNLILTTVGNFDTLNNNATPGSHAHYTNLEADHADKAIIKLKLSPSTKAIFDQWANNLRANTINLEVLAERHDNQKCAYGSDEEEVQGAGVFLNDDTTGKFRMTNRNFYEVYSRRLTAVATTGINRGNFSDSYYNFLGLIGTERKKIRSVENPSSTQVVYFYYDKYDNEVIVATCNRISIRSRNNGVQVGHVIPGYITKETGGGGEADFNYIYPDQSILTTGSHRNGSTDRHFPNQLRNVQFAVAAGNVFLIRMPDSLNINQNGVIISYGFSGSQRRFCNPQCFAAFIGVLAELSIIGINSTGMCFGDGTSYPSVSHPNGDSIDTSYLDNHTQQQNLLDAFVSWNFSQVIAGTNKQSWLHNAHMYNGDHNTHLHSGNFSDTAVESLF